MSYWSGRRRKRRLKKKTPDVPSRWNLRRWVASPSPHKEQNLDETTMTIRLTEENDVAITGVESESSLVRREDDSGRRSWRAASLRRLGPVTRFSSLLSTEQLHGSDDLSFYGPYAHLRRVLDYSYYRNYSKERQWLQDAIIEDMLDNVEDPDVCITPTEPWFIFTVGARGAGKNHVIHSLVKSGRLPILSFVHVDSDSIRRRLPEFESYSKLNPTLVNDLTRNECGYMAELLLLAGLQNGRNVVFDSAMRNAEWFSSFIGTLKKSCAKEMFGLLTHIKIAVLHITAPTDVILKRVQMKSMETGREIDEESILKSLKAIPASLEVVKKLVDFYCEIFNGVDEYELVGGDITWDDFNRTFSQTCAWKPGMKGTQKIQFASTQHTEDAHACSIRKARETRKPFSVLISSEENNKSDDMNFYGKYSYIRKTLDYGYHSNYTFERQKLQDAIINDMLDEAFVFDEDGNVGTVPTEPWIVFTAGAMGAGKSHTMGVLVEKGRFPLTAFVRVDPDEVRRTLPEYHVYIIENPELAGELTKKEAGYISEILTLAALQGGKNVLQDGSLRDADWYQTYMLRLRKEFPHVRQGIIHVTAPRDAVFQRAEQRAIATGRIVPRKLLEEAMIQVPRSVQILSPLVDYYAKIDNPQTSGDVYLIKPEGSTWEEFKRQWIQTVAYIPNRKKLLKKAEKARLRLESAGSSISESLSHGNDFDCG